MTVTINPVTASLPPQNTKPVWHFVVTDIHGVAIGEITEATQRQVTFLLRDACSVSLVMDATSPQALMVQEGTTDLMVYRNDQLMFRGRFGSSQDTMGAPNTGGGGGADPDTHTVQFSAIDYRGMLGYRIFGDPGATYTNTDQSLIAWQMIAASEMLGQWPGDWGIRQGNIPTSVSRSQTISAGTLVGQAITDISNMDAGFDWEVDPYLRFNTWPQASLGVLNTGRGSNKGVVLSYGDNVMGALRSLDMSQYANSLRYAGAGSLVSTVDIISAGIATVWPQTGQWQAEMSNTNLTDQTSVNNAAKAELVAKAALVPSYSLTLTHRWWNPQLLWLGDTVQVNVQHGRLSENFAARVSEIDLYLGDEANEETIVVTVGKRMGSLLRRLPSQEKKLEQIAKRV